MLMVRFRIGRIDEKNRSVSNSKAVVCVKSPTYDVLGLHLFLYDCRSRIMNMHLIPFY